VPDEIPSDEEQVTLDFTRLSSRDLGAVHSRFAVRHSHVLFHTAVREADVLGHRRNLRMAEAKFRVVHAGEKKTDVDALMEENPRIVRLRDRVMQADAEVEILEAVASGYEAIRNAASREISRRIGERAPID